MALSRAYRDENDSKIKSQIEEILYGLPDFVSLYKSNMYKSVAPSTLLAYLRDIKTFFEYIVETHDLKLDSTKDVTLEVLISIDKPYIDSYAEYLDYHRKNGKNGSNQSSTIRRRLASLRSLYSYLYENDLISANPMTKVKVPKVAEKDIVYMNIDEIDSFMSAVYNGKANSSNIQQAYHDKLCYRDTVIITFLLNTGLRVSEFCSLDISDLDLNHHSLRVIRKGGNEKNIPLSDSLTELLTDYLEYRKLQHPEKGHEDALFLSIQNKRLGVRSVENIVSKYCKIASLNKNITAHKLRSTCGTMLYTASNDIYYVAEMLNHKSVDTTKRFYSNLSEGKLRERRNTLDDFFKTQ